MADLYGVCRVSTKKQNIERQIRNIKSHYPDAKIIQDKFTGTKLEGRKEFEKLLKIIKENDTLVFDSVSRFSRNADEGCELYESLFNRNINIVFLKESHINTEVYRKALKNQIDIQLNTGDAATDTFVNSIIESLNQYTIEIAKSQIRDAFKQAEKEVQDLHIKTSEGMLTAKLNGKQIGQKQGTKLVTKKSKEVKALILKHSKDFNGTLNDIDCMKLVNVARNTYYSYKRDLKRETVFQ